MNIRLTKNQKPLITNTQDVFDIMQQILLRETKIRRGQEHFWIIGLNPVNKILFIELLALGSNNRVFIKAPQVFKMAIHENASKVIFIHNHPSGFILPSQDDINTTDRLIKAGEIVDIEVVDHIIISESDYYSFNNSGLIIELKNNGVYQIVSKDRIELEKWKIERAATRATKNTNKEIAKKLLTHGVMSREEIKKITGLNFQEFKKIVRELEKLNLMLRH